MKKVLLYSGGMDSWLISHLWKPLHYLIGFDDLVLFFRPPAICAGLNLRQDSGDIGPDARQAGAAVFHPA